MAKVTKAQAEALQWLYPTSRRRWCGPIVGDPSTAALDALVRKGLASKAGSAGWPIEYSLTDAGRAERHHLKGEEDQ